MATKLTTAQIAAKKAALPSNQVAQAAPVIRQAPSSTLTPYQQSIQNNAGNLTPLPQQEREDARLAWIDSQSGTMGQEGIDPYRLINPLSPDYLGSTDQRKDVNAPLGATSGARGVVGQLGDTSKSRVDQPLGVIDQTAVNRIMQQRGVSEEEARAQVQANRTDVQQAFETYGLTEVEDAAVSRYANAEGYATAPTPGEVQQYRNALQEAKILESQAKAVEAEQKSKVSQYAPKFDTSSFDQTRSQIDTVMSSISHLSPDLQAAAIPGLLQLQYQSNEASRIAQQTIDSQPTDKEIESQYGTVEKYIESEAREHKAFLQKNLEMQREIATYNRDTLEAEKKIMDHDAAIAAQKQLIANTEGEKQLRRQLNRLGIQTDVQGLTYLQSEVQKGVDALENLKTSNNLVSLRAQLAIGEGYRLEVQQALNNYEGKYLELSSMTNGKLMDIKNSISMAKADKAKAIIEAKKWEYEQKSVNDREVRGIIASANKTMQDNINKQRDDDMKKEENAWDRLNWAISTYGSDAPLGILESIQKDLPGTDISSILGNPTLAQLKMVKSKSGGGGSFAGSYDTSATPQGNAFSEITSRQLREAVDRVTLGFGGTGEERSRKRSEYLGRINSGESTASIMSSMQADYWASQKGAPGTAHEGRIEAQASSEALESYVEFYGITPDSDGVLGQLDSRKQGFLSVFGASSEEYNNLANQVGNIRASIIKKNYGAAVTPQELAIAKSYIPDMTDKGGMFVTKLQNLKSYNAYLDAKVFADQVGLPAPTPPVPVTLSGDGMTGTSKYSSDDITSALLE
jgi:hypothetical protein